MSSDRELEARLTEYLDRKLKIGKLDSALLFISSSTSLIFAFLQGITTPAVRLAVLVPVIVLGWAVPVFLGYIRGGITRPSAIDRLRGWIFLVVGLGGYSWILLMLWISSGVQNATLFLYTPTLLSVPVILPLIRWRRRLREFVFKTVGENYTETDSNAAWNCVKAAGFLAASFLGPTVGLGSLVGNLWLGYLAVIGVFYFWRSQHFVARIGLTPSRIVRPSLFPRFQLTEKGSLLLLLASATSGLLSFISLNSLSNNPLAVVFGTASLVIVVFVALGDRFFESKTILRYPIDHPGIIRTKLAKAVGLLFDRFLANALIRIFGRGLHRVPVLKALSTRVAKIVLN